MDDFTLFLALLACSGSVAFSLSRWPRRSGYRKTTRRLTGNHSATAKIPTSVARSVVTVRNRNVDYVVGIGESDTHVGERAEQEKALPPPVAEAFLVGST
jgi:hypothetical protein